MNFLQMFHQLLGQVRQVDERHLNVRWHLGKNLKQLKMKKIDFLR